MEEPLKLADLLAINRNALPAPVAERSLALDLPLLAGLLDLIKPHQVHFVRSTGPLFVLRNHRCNSAPPGRTAILGTLFEMYDKAAIVAAMAAHHEEAVLLLAFAEDSRLRTVIRNPFIAPHVHMFGGTSGILIVNLAAIRRTGGQDLLDAFCWILSRIAAKTPERIVRQDDPLQRVFLERQCVLALDVLVESASPAACGDFTRVLSATLRPELANGMQVSLVSKRLQNSLSQEGSYLDLVDPALVDELTVALQQLAQQAAETAPFDVLVTAHRAAFRIGEILVGWRRFGLENNTTAQLGRAIAAVGAKEGRESVDQYLPLGMVTLVDAVLAAAKETTQALSVEADKHGSKVIQLDTQSLISVALAAAKQACEVLPDAARRLFSRTLHTQGACPGGILRPKPLKPFGEYIDFYRTEAGIMRNQGIPMVIRLPLDGLRGGLDHVVRLNQAAREVEISLRLLGERFPDEEIVWVDAGCSYGVLLNTVEPPSNVRDRCRFLGFDFNAPAVAVGRTAASNMGRIHCRFEVGDVADARAITNNSRIHLITAFEVLEHCPDPLAVLRNYREMEPGMLVVGSPLGEPQGILPTEQHLWLWDAGGFTQMVEASGFSILGVNQRHVGRFIGGHDWVTVTAITAEPKVYAVV